MQGHSGAHSAMDLPVRVNHDGLGRGQHCGHRGESDVHLGPAGTRGGEVSGGPGHRSGATAEVEALTSHPEPESLGSLNSWGKCRVGPSWSVC